MESFASTKRNCPNPRKTQNKQEHRKIRAGLPSRSWRQRSSRLAGIGTLAYSPSTCPVCRNRTSRSHGTVRIGRAALTEEPAPLSSRHWLYIENADSWTAGANHPYPRLERTRFTETSGYCGIEPTHFLPGTLGVEHPLDAGTRGVTLLLPGLFRAAFMHGTTRQYARIVRGWISESG